MYLIKTPWLLKKFYPSLVWNKPRQDKTIYLTFDDGPIPGVTTFVLETLSSFNIKATFFCIGDNIQKHPEVFAQVKTAGHTIGNHTFHHLRGWDTKDDVYENDFRACQKLMETDLFRPPYGRIKKSQIRLLKQAYPELNIIMWDVLSGDFDTELDPEECLQNVLKYTENGSVVVFHDSLKASERLTYVLPKALEFWVQKGYTFSALG